MQIFQSINQSFSAVIEKQRGRICAEHKIPLADCQIDWQHGVIVTKQAAPPVDSAK
jgi:hypothetical protein